jgi:uncharacterized RDD family membrane protein YckC
MALEAQAAASSPERIGFGKRLGAALLDLLIVAVVGGGIGIVFGAALGGMMGAAAIPLPGGAAVGGVLGALVGFSLGSALVAPFYGLWEGLTGAAAGKRILGIRIANENGSRAAIGTLLSRYAIKNINFILTLVSLVVGDRRVGQPRQAGRLHHLHRVFLCARRKTPGLS